MVSSTALCPVCGAGLDSNVCHCPRCETPHHLECWSWAGGCSIYGCGCSTLTLPAPEEPPESDFQAELTDPERVLPAAASELTILSPTVSPGDSDGLHWLRVLPAAQPLYFAVATLLGLFFSNSWGSLAWALGLALVPFLLARSRTTFDVAAGELGLEVTVFDRVLHRKRIPFEQILRLEVREVETELCAVVVQRNGSTFQVAMVEREGDAARDCQRLWLRRVVRGVQLHTKLPVTRGLRIDPSSCLKRLETLKEAHRQHRLRIFGLAALPAVLSVPALFLFYPLSLVFFATLGTLAAATLLWEAILPSGFVGNMIPPQTLPAIEQELCGRQPDRRSVTLQLEGYVLMIVEMIVLGRTGDHIPAVASLCLGLIFCWYKWTRALLLGKTLLEAENAPDDEEEPPE
ncbi:MAG: hypothetical protein HY815_06715 [Candidatus Riflebacteria bacterium]|nr:hypothetical protein [Candidatus Riflebacteria bacterium]